MMSPGRLRLRRRSRASAPLTAETRPLLASGITFERAADDAAWIALSHGVPSSRVSPGVMHLLTAMNGEIALRDLHLRFAASEPFESFLQLIRRFRASGLLEGHTTRAPGRVVYRPPFTVQLATLRAPHIFRRLDRMMIPLSRRAALISLVVLLCLGTVATAVQASLLRDVIATPMPLSGLVTLVVALSLMTLLHESAHGIALTRFGGRPRRAGFMLYYLTPAFFVDVTDGWRLPDRRQRVATALAGPAVHAVVAAAALTVALIVPQHAVRQTLLLFALSCAAIVVVNLIPFLRFDGYIALMSALDEPNLRARTMRDAAAFLTRLLFGGRRTSKNLDAWWSVPFGLTSLVAPSILVLLALARMVRVLSAGAPLLGALVVALEAAVVLVGLVFVARAVHRVLRAGVSRLRFACVCAALVSGVVIAGSVIPMPLSVTLGFATHGEHVVLVQPGETAAARVPEGARVVLLSNGLLVNEQVGAGIAGQQRPEPTSVPLDAVFPVTAPGVTIPAVVVAEVDVSDESGPIPQTGQARVEIGATNLWQSLWTTGVMAPLSSLWSEK